MEQSPSSEANRFTASQEIPRILWNPNSLPQLQVPPPPVPILSQLDPVHTPTSHFLKIHSYRFINTIERCCAEIAFLFSMVCTHVFEPGHSLLCLRQRWAKFGPSAFAVRPVVWFQKHETKNIDFRRIIYYYWDYNIIFKPKQTSFISPAGRPTYRAAFIRYSVGKGKVVATCRHVTTQRVLRSASVIEVCPLSFMMFSQSQCSTEWEGSITVATEVRTC